MGIALGCFWLGLAFLTSLGAIFMMGRNNRVCDHLLALNKRVYAAAVAGLLSGRLEQEWRWDLLDDISYSRMLLLFWRPFESFYDLDALLTPDPPANNEKFAIRG